MRWVALLYVVFPAAVAAQSKPVPPRHRSALDLFAFASKYIDVNRVFCSTTNFQGSCVQANS